MGKSPFYNKGRTDEESIRSIKFVRVISYLCKQMFRSITIITREESPLAGCSLQQDAKPLSPLPCL